MSPRKHKAVKDGEQKLAEPKPIKSTQPKQRKAGGAAKAQPDRPPTAEMHRRVLMQSPVPASVVVEWASRMAEDATIDSDTIEHHLSQVCTSANFGEWAHGFGRNRNARSWSYLKRGIRSAYAEASWKQRIDGIFVALGCDLTSESIVHNDVRDARLTEIDMERLVNAVVAFHSDRIRGGDRLKDGQKALSLLGLAGVSQILARRITAWKQELPDAAEPSEPISDDKVRTTFPVVAAIVLRSRECRDLENYMAESRSVSLTSETLYLASTLTYRPEWIVLFEQPMSLRLGAEKVRVDSVSGTLSDEWVDVRFRGVASPEGRLPVRIPVRPGRRTFDPTMSEHAALALLDLLFSREENLQSTHAAGDRKLANTRLKVMQKTASTIYRLSDWPRWGGGELSAGRLELRPVSVSPRRAHDVRGHFRTRNGVSRPVRPHRRRS